MSIKVFDELTCPDCGGHIGSTSLPAGMRPCTCFEEAPKRKRPLPDEPDPVDLLPAGTGVSADGKKRCRVCQKDLTGRSRLKDEKGYICKKCSDKEYEVEAEAERDAIECPECHRKLKAAGFIEYRGNLICRRCHAHHQDNDKLKVAKLGELTLHKEEEKKSVMMLSIIAGVLLLIGLVKTFIIGW